MNIRGRVEIVSYPERLVARLGANKAAIGKMFEGNAQQRQAFMQRLVEQRGLRAQLRSGNLLTGQLFVAFDLFPDAPKVKIDWSRDPCRSCRWCRAQSRISKRKVTGILAKLDNLPYEAIGADLTKALASLDQTLKIGRQGSEPH